MGPVTHVSEPPLTTNVGWWMDERENSSVQGEQVSSMSWGGAAVVGWSW
jgi:hypothetical protein